jgi:hypothetical protein
MDSEAEFFVCCTVILAEWNPVSWIIGSILADRFDMDGRQQALYLHAAYRTTLPVPLEYIE